MSQCKYSALIMNKVWTQSVDSEQRTKNKELRILFNIIHEDCNKLVIVTIIKITVINRKIIQNNT